MADLIRLVSVKRSIIINKVGRTRMKEVADISIAIECRLHRRISWNVNPDI
ncbi:MAG: hypothetical protein ABII90_11550 [Bacteroidota bacterium]